MTPLKSIDEEKEDCIQSFKDSPESTLAWTCHHEMLIEPLIESYQERIDYILANKATKKQASRLRNFRPVRIKLPEPVNGALKAYDEASKAHNKAWQTYDKALKAYNEAWQTYDKASKAHNKAWQTYDKALKVYEEALKVYYAAKKVYNDILKTHSEELTKLHNEDWPDNSWNGKSIF